MDWSVAELVYYSLQGELIEPIPGVENLFAEGMPCDQRYKSMLEAYERLRGRLGVTDEDQDVETIIDSLLMNQQELCIKMYAYGAKFHK